MPFRENHCRSAGYSWHTSGPSGHTNVTFGKDNACAKWVIFSPQDPYPCSKKTVIGDARPLNLGKTITTFSLLFHTAMMNHPIQPKALFQE
jgi:hypothetical protein